ncbi:hypothetical protein PPYR_01443 [Photinus pyralis]|uniref:Uncharacterized protein n=1 Tax=Photinus pyralis TaxID=7054 RepID=A0A5N4B4J5_PHOPY|nr:hypothetical protein PPYR_01443 [Photinus pyralis]
MVTWVAPPGQNAPSGTGSQASSDDRDTTPTIAPLRRTWRSKILWLVGPGMPYANARSSRTSNTSEPPVRGPWHWSPAAAMRAPPFVLVAKSRLSLPRSRSESPQNGLRGGEACVPTARVSVLLRLTVWGHSSSSNVSTQSNTSNSESDILKQYTNTLQTYTVGHSGTTHKFFPTGTDKPGRGELRNYGR